MFSILNMVKTTTFGNLQEFKFDFEFDEASTLPINFVVVGQNKYLIAEGSTARNVSNSTYYKYNGAGKEWTRVLPTPTPVPINNTKITDNGNYNFINNDFTGYAAVTVDVSDGGDSATLIEKTVTENGTYTASDDNADGYSEVTVNVSGNVVLSVTPDLFNLSTNLKKITIPDGITHIAGGSFSYYTGLTDVIIPPGVTGASEGAFYNCTSLENVTIPDGDFRFIDTTVFYNCTSLKNITLPSSMGRINVNAFQGCTSLETMTFKSTTPPELGGDIGLPTTCTIRVPQGTLSAYTSAKYYPDPSTYTYEEY